ncbi:MAG: cytidylyltransferase domain-containing protein [Spirochaetia bacterium]
MSTESAIFVQARLDSSRLPGKALLPLDQHTSMLACVLKNLYGCAQEHLLLCPPDAVQAFYPIAKSSGYKVIEGPKEDVLGRFALAQKKVQAQWIIRATADNPVVPYQLAQSLLNYAQKQNAHYACFQETPHGAGVQVITGDALLIADKECENSQEREHVCPYITRQRDRFKICEPKVAQRWREPDLRATVDTPEDYEYIKKFYQWKADKNQDILENFIVWANLIHNVKVG